MVRYEELTEEQQRAVDALDRNVTLTAGAGTGKTTTLTARYLAMFERALEERGYASDGGSTSGSDADPDVLGPENVLTTTFTERGANELEESIRGEITDRIESLDVEAFEDWRTIADELENGYIHTLHGFCARLLREHALTIDAVDPGFDTLDEDETTALVDDTVSTVLEEYEMHDATRTLARQFSRRQLQNVLTDLLQKRPESIEWADEWADASESEYLSFVRSTLHPIDPDEAARRLADPEFVAAATTLREFVNDPPDIDTGGQVWQRAEGVVAILDDGFEFDDGVASRHKQTLIAELSVHLTKNSGDRYAGNAGASTRWSDHPRKEEFDRAFETLVETLEPEQYAVDVDIEREAESVPFVTALAELTRVAATEYEDRKRRQNLVDFSDQISHAVEFLDDDANARIREQLRQQFEYVMVDEFQDTDPRQWDLIKLLTSGDRDRFDARNVFVVGDVKQSIYRFRNADVAQFRETAETLRTFGDAGQMDGNDQLSRNFRTLPTVLESINELFESVFEENGDPYEAPPQSLRPDRQDPADLGSVEYLAVPTDPELRARRFGHYEAFATAEPDHDTELEAMALAARLSQVLADPYQVYPESDEVTDDEPDSETNGESKAETGDDERAPEPREISPDDIAVLIRSRTHLKAYERALEDADVPYSVASGLGFYESTEITALLNLFRTLADPEDERALYAVLRSPLFGFTDDTLARLKADAQDPETASLRAALARSDHEDLVEAHTMLQEWRRRAGLGEAATGGIDDSWAAFLTDILEETGYPVGVSADERPEQARANVEKFREQLRALSEDGVRSLTTLVNRIERRIDLGGRESEANTTGDGVRIMTIHDAKGMEFPFVVVPGIHRGFNDQAALGDGQVEFERIGDEHAVGLKAPNPDDPFDPEDTLARRTIRERRRAEERAEEKRVLYVACTRARDHLLLSGCHESAGEADTPTLTDLTGADSDPASSWRDWVQPELLPEDVRATLDDAFRIERAYGDGAYTVSLPTPPVERARSPPDTDPAVGLTPDPTPSEISFRFSATDLASLFGEYGVLRIDDETGVAYVEEVDDGSPDRRHGEPEPTVAPGERDRARTSQSQREEGTIDAAVFGELVHRLCELRPPEDEWATLMEQTLADQDAAVTITPELERQVARHARRGMEYVDALGVGGSVEYRYDELYVTADFDRGEISGYIDHLTVTTDCYHVVDYKTGDVADELDADAEYYVNQMKAYAVALNQQGTGRDVHVTLLFTTPDEAWDVTWSADDVATIESDLEDELERRIETRSETSDDSTDTAY